MSGIGETNDKPTAVFDPAPDAKMLLRTVRTGALATLAAEAGPPFASLANVATMPDGSPILLLSQLAAHTRHLERDGRLSLLLATTGAGDPLSHARLTLVGTAEVAAEPARRAALAARFLARHPYASLYAGFGDFSFWCVAVTEAHLNGGFARAGRLSGAALMTDVAGADALLAAEPDALAHMNADHAEALALYATVLAGEPAGAWVATGIDPDGIDLACEAMTSRIAFPTRVCDPGALRQVLRALADQARASRDGAADMLSG